MFESISKSYLGETVNLVLTENRNISVVVNMDDGLLWQDKLEEFGFGAVELLGEPDHPVYVVLKIGNCYVQTLEFIPAREAA